MKKPPIDKENAVDAEIVEFPTIPAPVNYLLTPKPGISVPEVLEIQTALLLKLVGAQMGEKGSLANIVLTEDYVSKLSDGAGRHFTKAA